MYANIYNIYIGIYLYMYIYVFTDFKSDLSRQMKKPLL